MPIIMVTRFWCLNWKARVESQPQRQDHITAASNEYDQSLAYLMDWYGAFYSRWSCVTAKHCGYMMTSWHETVFRITVIFCRYPSVTGYQKIPLTKVRDVERDQAAKWTYSRVADDLRHHNGQVWYQFSDLGHRCHMKAEETGPTVCRWYF